MQHKNLFRKLERTLRKIEGSSDQLATTAEILRRLVDDFRDDLGLVGGRIYARQEDGYVLEREYPAGRARLGFRIPAAYPVVQELAGQGFVYRRPEDPDVDREIEAAIGVEGFAAIMVGHANDQIIAFSVAVDADASQIVHTLNTVRLAINLKLRHEFLQDRVLEAKEIQLSLLPPKHKVFGDFDIYAETRTAEEVGGDLFDYLPISKRSLGLVVADASGHGLPAALQARDAIIGLRMGVAESLRITATLDKLNKVIHRSALASKFISLFYGELETNGTFVFCNAGHPPALVWDGAFMAELNRGGMVLGPNPEATYERHYTSLGPGTLLLAYTDGITEAENAAGESFGAERLRRIVKRREWTQAKDLVEGVFEAVQEFSGKASPDDDQTVLAVVRAPLVTP